MRTLLAILLLPALGLAAEGDFRFSTSGAVGQPDTEVLLTPGPNAALIFDGFGDLSQYTVTPFMQVLGGATSFVEARSQLQLTPGTNIVGVSQLSLGGNADGDDGKVPQFDSLGGITASSLTSVGPILSKPEGATTARLELWDVADDNAVYIRVTGDLAEDRSIYAPDILEGDLGSTDNALVTVNGTGGHLAQAQGAITVSDSGHLTVPNGVFNDPSLLFAGGTNAGLYFQSAQPGYSGDGFGVTFNGQVPFWFGQSTSAAAHVLTVSGNGGLAFGSINQIQSPDLFLQREAARTLQFGLDGGNNDDGEDYVVKASDAADGEDGNGGSLNFRWGSGDGSGQDGNVRIGRYGEVGYRGFSFNGVTGNALSLTRPADGSSIWNVSQDGYQTARGYNIVVDGLGVNFAATNRIISGTGDPENVYSAPSGSIFLRTDGGELQGAYAKASDTTSEGWLEMVGLPSIELPTPTMGSNWTDNADETYTSTSPFFDGINYNAPGLEDGGVYMLKLTIESYTSGAIAVYLGASGDADAGMVRMGAGSGHATGLTISYWGTYSAVNSHALHIRAQSGFSGTLSNIKLTRLH